MVIGQGDILGFTIPAWIAAIAFLLGSICLNFTASGRYVLAIGGNEEAARLEGLPVDSVKLFLYLLSGLLFCPSGGILAAQLTAARTIKGEGAGQFPIRYVRGR